MSTKVDACPKCGAKIKRTGLFTKLLAGIIALGIVGAIVGQMTASVGRGEGAGRRTAI